MTQRQRMNAAREYCRNCRIRRFRRFLWALSGILWAAFIGLILWLSLDKPQETPTEPENVTPSAAVVSAIPAAEYLTPALPNIGTFEICGYCPCCTPYADINQRDGRVLTASGEWTEIGQCVAADTDIIPLGSTVIIDGQAYTALDTGVKGYVIDILMCHEDAQCAGVRTEVVTWVEG